MKHTPIIRIFLLFIPIVLTVIIIINACVHDTEGVTELRKVCFTSEILPIFQTNCAMSGCHDREGEEDFVLNNYEGIMKGVSPGNPYNSKVYESIIDIWGEIMPPDKALSQNQRTLIKIWIEQGATNCTTDTLPDPIISGTLRACYSRDIQPILSSSCAMSGCHNSPGADDIDLTSFAKLKQSTSSNKLWETISKNEMPPSGSTPLLKAQKDSIQKWIQYGSIDEECAIQCDTNIFTFSEAVWPTINTNCVGCHSGSSASKGVKLDNHSNIAAAASSGQLTGSLRGQGYSAMPPSGKLSECQIKQIEKWVAAGKLNN